MPGCSCLGGECCRVPGDCDQQTPLLRAVDQAICKSSSVSAAAAFWGVYAREELGLWSCINWHFKGEIFCFLVYLFASHWGISCILR